MESGSNDQGEAAPVAAGTEQIMPEPATASAPAATSPPANAEKRMLFSPLVEEFKPKWATTTTSALEFPSPESASSSEGHLETPDLNDDGQEWAFTSGGQLVDSSGMAWEVADEILRLQSGDAVPVQNKAPLAQPMQPFSPTPTIANNHQINAYCSGKLGEPDESFPFNAFSTWRQKKMVDTLPTPPTGIGHRRRRSGSQSSVSSGGSGLSVSYLPTANYAGQPFESPRAAFANFEAVQSRRSSSSSPSPTPGQMRPLVAPPAGMTYNGGHFPYGRATEGQPIPRLAEQQNQQASIVAQQALALNNPLATFQTLASQAVANPDFGAAILRIAAMTVSGQPTGTTGPSPHNRKLGLYKTELCRSWEDKGSCRYGPKCQFAHGREELRPTGRGEKTKSEICRAFANSGTCPYGKRCIFRHEPAHAAAVPEVPMQPGTSSISPAIQPSLVQRAMFTPTYGATASSSSSLSSLVATSDSETTRAFSTMPLSSGLIGAEHERGIGWRSRSSSEGSLLTFGGGVHAGGLGISSAMSPPIISQAAQPPARLEPIRSRASHPLPPPAQGSLLADLRADDAPWPTSSRTQTVHPMGSNDGSTFAPFDAFKPLGVNFDRTPGARRPSLPTASQ